jgi:outer membrane protein TolC
LLAAAGLVVSPAPLRAQARGGDGHVGGAVTVSAHRYTLAECLALADRNFPNLWAARARLELAHAQLEEARWTPWFQWSAQGSLGLAPPLLGSILYPQSTLASRNITSILGLRPYAGFGVNGVVPLYTFGKIETARDAAEAYVRVTQWDAEKWRQQTRLDVRRAYFGLQLARDSRYLLAEAISLDSNAITAVT